MLLEFLVFVPPRLALIGFRFAQPFLIKRIIEMVGSQHDNSFGVNGDIARGLVAATALVYIGIAVSNCLYTHLTIRLLTCLRGALVSLIFVKILRLRSYADGAPVTLMSTDIDGIVSGMEHNHDIWACVFELAIGIFLLYREIGPACFLVFAPILGTCTTVTARRD
jgi:ATP-binding cassette, subfamily C (CFTR/MRP), member 1